MDSSRAIPRRRRSDAGSSQPATISAISKVMPASVEYLVMSLRSSLIWRRVVPTAWVTVSPRRISTGHDGRLADHRRDLLAGMPDPLRGLGAAEHQVGLEVRPEELDVG